MSSAFADGVDESDRGLWRSAVESFGAASEAAPHHPAPVLAEAVCLLHLDRARDAVVLLETHAALRSVGAEWAGRTAWLRAAARLAMDDPLGAEIEAREMAADNAQRVLCQAAFAVGDLPKGLAQLLKGRERRPR